MSMKAGRELDILISMRVFGNTESEAKFLRALHDEISFRPLGAGYLYSTDIAAAWEVVEKLGLLDSGDHLFREKDRWIVGDENQETGEPFYLATAKTAPLAICLAALRSIGVEILA